MASTTGIEKVILSVGDLAGFPKLQDFVTQYNEQLQSGYEPDPALLTDIFLELVAVATDDTVLAAALVELETTIVEEILVRDTDLGNNDGLVEVLNFYTGLIEAGYEPDETTQTAIVDNLSGVTSDDPALQDIIDDAVSTVGGEELNIVSLNDALVSGAGPTIILEATAEADVFVFDPEAYFSDPSAVPDRQIEIVGFDVANDQIVFANYDGDGNGILAQSYLELLSENTGWTMVNNAGKELAYGFRFLTSTGNNFELLAFDQNDQLVSLGPSPDDFSTQTIQDETSTLVFYADEIIFADDLIA